MRIVRSLNPSGSGYNYSYGFNHLKTGLVKIWTFLFGFQMVFDKMAAKFVWISKQTVFQISSIIGNVDHLETNLCLGFKWSGFWISDLI